VTPAERATIRAMLDVPPGERATWVPREYLVLAMEAIDGRDRLLRGALATIDAEFPAQCSSYCDRDDPYEELCNRCQIRATIGDAP
jgi:hypothetical protein